MIKDPICGMDINEKSALRLDKNGQSYYFCSKHCLKRFAKQKDIKNEKILTCAVSHKAKWYKNKFLIVVLILILFFLLSYILPILKPFREALSMYFKRIWWAILLGLFLAGVMDHFVPQEYISHILARPQKKTIFYSVIFGFFMSTCSHGILALAIELHKKGASNPAVVAFLLASPWANLPITIMLISFFGFKALYIIFCALLVAITTGFIYQFLETKRMIERNKNVKVLDTQFSIVEDLRLKFSSYKLTSAQLAQDIKGILSGSISLANMVLWWVLIGIGLASLAAAYIPPNIFQQYMGPTILGLFVTLIIATILEVCSEGTAPLAFEIYRQTSAFGNVFVFLMAGVVTDYTEIGLLWFNVGRKVALWLPIITVPQVVFLGLLANMIF